MIRDWTTTRDGIDWRGGGSGPRVRRALGDAFGQNGLVEVAGGCFGDDTQVVAEPAAELVVELQRLRAVAASSEDFHQLAIRGFPQVIDPDLLPCGTFGTYHVSYVETERG